jgi:hypothetical protein
MDLRTNATEPFNDLNKLFFNFIWDVLNTSYKRHLSKMGYLNILEISRIFSFCKEKILSLPPYCQPPFQLEKNLFIQRGNAGVTSLNHIMDTVTKIS